MKKHGSFVILTRKNKSEVFLVKRSDIPVWEIQGGGIEKGERPEQTAIREAFEETGFKIKIIKKIAEYYLKGKIVIHFYEGKIISGKYKREYPKCEGKWFRFNNLPKYIINHKLDMIDKFLKNKERIIKNDLPNLISISNLKVFLRYPLKTITYLIKRLI